jgi:GT2 family glycosyltransferase
MAVSLPLPENVGFGRACNRGLELIDEPVSVLINPDAELLDDSLAALADDALRSPERLLAPLVLSPDGSRQDTVHPRPASLPDVMRAVLPSRLVLGATPWRARRARPVGWAVGCALAARTETLRALGPFDPEIFMYGEDLDLGLRAGQAGIATWFCPRARVLHHAAHSTATALGGERFRLLARNRHEVVARRLGRRSAAVDDAAQAVTFISRILAKRVMGRDARRERQALRALLALRHGR